MSEPESTAVEPNELVFAVCHEVGNLLAATGMHVELLSAEGDSADVDGAAGTISQLSSRIGSLISLIRPILSQSTGSPQPIDPLDVFEGLQWSLDENCEQRVRFNLRSAVDLNAAAIDADALQHVLLAVIYSGLEDSDPSGVVLVSALSNADEVTFVVEWDGPDRQTGRALRGQVLAQRIADWVLGARGGRMKTAHRDGSNRAEFTVPTAKAPAGA